MELEFIFRDTAFKHNLTEADIRRKRHFIRLAVKISIIR
jgi:hypothetical protein